MIIHGNSLEELKKLEENSIDSIVTDPPYELGFMGKSWDASGIAYNVELWKECLRVLKPGGHLLAFSGTRTYHRMTCSIEDAGFEIRDMIEWIYNTGFPKSHNIAKAITSIEKTGKSNPKALRETRMGEEYEPTGQEDYSKGRMFSSEIKHDLRETELTEQAKQWEGWGTNLKPAHEPICLARKPINCKSIAENVLTHGTGGLNIDKCRIGDEIHKVNINDLSQAHGNNFGKIGNTYKTLGQREQQGRFPANLVTLEEESEIVESKYFNITPKHLQKKASKKDRNSDYLGQEIQGEKKQKIFNGQSDKPSTEIKDVEKRFMTQPTVNNHPTVKPVELMEWLIKLITPPNGTVLDPFAGSGSTLVAAKKNGFSYIGIELTEEYIDIIKSRLGEI